MRKTEMFKELIKGVLDTHVNRPETPNGCRITPDDVNDELDKALKVRFYESCKAAQRGKFKEYDNIKVAGRESESTIIFDMWDDIDIKLVDVTKDISAAAEDLDLKITSDIQKRSYTEALNDFAREKGCTHRILCDDFFKKIHDNKAKYIDFKEEIETNWTQFKQSFKKVADAIMFLRRCGASFEIKEIAGRESESTITISNVHFYENKV